MTALTDPANLVGAFSENATGLLPGTNYAFRAFSTNGGGTGYGAVVIFTTLTTPAPSDAGGPKAGQGPAQYAPTVKKTFAVNQIALGGNTTMTITVTNPNATPLTGVGFVDTLPAGITVSPGAVATTTCTAGMTPVTPTTVSLLGATLAANASCTVTVSVTGGATNGIVTNKVRANANGTGFGNEAVASLTVGTAVNAGGPKVN